LGYQMDYVARGLRSGRTGFVALVVPNLSEPYFAELAEAVIRAARRKHLIVLVEATGGDPDVELAVMRGALANVADGVLLSSVSATIEGAPEGAVVMLGEHAASPKVQHVGIDNVAAARTVVEHLLEQGYHRIAALGVQDTDTARQRYDGFRQGLAAAGKREVKPLEIADHTWSPQAGYDAVLQMLKRRTKLPTAILAFNDSLAIGALRGLHDKHISVPDEIAVAGIDNITQSAFASPPLTTIAPDLDELATQALDLLADQVAGRGSEHTPTKQTMTSFRLVVRASTRSSES
jgi:DNA-binding LacI/PurR family transcriptional regulator